MGNVDKHTNQDKEVRSGMEDYRNRMALEGSNTPCAPGERGERREVQSLTMVLVPLSTPRRRESERPLKASGVGGGPCLHSVLKFEDETSLLPKISLSLSLPASHFAPSVLKALGEGGALLHCLANERRRGRLLSFNRLSLSALISNGKRPCCDRNHETKQKI